MSNEGEYHGRWEENNLEKRGSNISSPGILWQMERISSEEGDGYFG